MPITAFLDSAFLRALRGPAGCAPGRGTTIALCSLLLYAAAGVAQNADAQMTQVPNPGPNPPAQLIGAPVPHAQGGGITIIPPPPVGELAQAKRAGASGQPARLTQAKQQFVNPERAYDPNTGQSLYWDCTRKTWVDSKTDTAVGYQGAKASDGEVIPPPPKLELADSERVTSEGLMARITQAKQDAGNPGRAFDADSGQILVWDRRQKSWIDTKTGEAVGFLGRKGVSACQPSGAPVAPPAQAALSTNPAVLDDLLFKDHVAVDASESTLTGMGQALLQMELLLTSKQSVIGGGLRLTGPPLPQADAKESTGAAASFGCLPCAAGETCPSACPEHPFFLRLSKAVSAGPL